MTFMLIVKGMWFGIVGVTENTDNKYIVEDYVTNPFEIDEADIYINLKEEMNYVENGILAKRAKHSLLNLHLDDIKEYEIEILDRILENKYKEDHKLIIVVYKKNITVYKYEFIHLDEQGEEINKLTIESSGRHDIETLDWNGRRRNKFLGLF